MLVTSLQVTALLFALPIYARLADHRISRREWMWAVILAAALAVVIIRDPATGQQRAPLHTWIIVAAVMGPALVLCVLAARIWAGRPVAAVLLAFVAGSSLALFAVLTKGVVEVAENGIGARAAGTGDLCLATGGAGRDDFPAVGFPGWRADRLVADDDRGQAGGGRPCSGSSCSARRCMPGRRVGCAARRGGAGDRCDRGAGSRRGRDDGDGQTAEQSASMRGRWRSPGR